MSIHPPFFYFFLRPANQGIDKPNAGLFPLHPAGVKHSAITAAKEQKKAICALFCDCSL
jgi:hypothetical protein